MALTKSIAEALKIRERNQITDVAVVQRLTKLRLKVRTTPGDLDLENILVISCVNAMEVTLRQTIRDIIDENARQTITGISLVKATPDDVKSVHEYIDRGRMSWGDIIATQFVPCNYANYFIETMNKILVDTFDTSLQTFSERATDNPASAYPMLSDLKVVMSDIQDIFTARHLVVHEAASERPISRTAILAKSQQLIDFLEAVILWRVRRLVDPTAEAKGIFNRA